MWATVPQLHGKEAMSMLLTQVATNVFTKGLNALHIFHMIHDVRLASLHTVRIMFIEPAVVWKLAHEESLIPSNKCRPGSEAKDRPLVMVRFYSVRCDAVLDTFI